MANLLMVFGEPGVGTRATGDEAEVELFSGVDVYDPTTGEIRSGSTDAIAWFIDTKYNGEGSSSAMPA